MRWPLGIYDRTPGRIRQNSLAKKGLPAEFSEKSPLAKVETTNDDSTGDFGFGNHGGEYRSRHRIPFRKLAGNEQYNGYPSRNQSGFIFRHVYSMYPLGMQYQIGSQKVRIDPILPLPI